MKLEVLSDNRQLLPDLKSEHGLCIYLETEKYKCLLDTGASANFIENAEKMEIYLDEVDYVFISHGHNDHTGGLSAFLKINSKAKIVISKTALTEHFFSVRNSLRNISSSLNSEEISDRFIFVNKKAVFEDEICVFPCQSSKHPLPKANSTLMKETEKGLIPDDFNHELVVCFGTEKLLVYTGCAHKGLLNILDSVSTFTSKQISYVVGGFHLLDSKIGHEFENKSQIDTIAQELKTKYPETRFITGHCTGETVFGQLKEQLGDQLIHFYTGFSMQI